MAKKAKEAREFVCMEIDVPSSDPSGCSTYVFKYNKADMQSATVTVGDATLNLYDLNVALRKLADIDPFLLAAGDDDVTEISA